MSHAGIKPLQTLTRIPANTSESEYSMATRRGARRP